MLSYLELMDANQKNLYLQKKVSLHNWIYYSIGIALVIIVMFFYRLIKKRKKEKEIPINQDNFSPKELIKNLSKTKDWAFFLEKFEVIHPLFFQKMIEKHPKLTPNDLKIVALLRLNVADKKIADLLSIEYSSFRKSKSRLKKKLDIEEEVSVATYILSI